VGPLIVEFIAEPVEATLLSGHAAGRRPSRLGFESSMHAFVAPVLLRLAWLDELGEDSQANPPSGEGGKAGEGVGGERDAVVSADPGGETEFLEQADEHGFGAENSRGMKGLATDKVATEEIGDSEGEAIDAVVGFELALEISTPEVVGSCGGGGGFAGMTDAAAITAKGHQVITLEDVLDGGSAGKIPGRMGAMDNG